MLVVLIAEWLVGDSGAGSEILNFTLVDTVNCKLKSCMALDS